MYLVDGKINIYAHVRSVRQFSPPPFSLPKRYASLVCDIFVHLKTHPPQMKNHSQHSSSHFEMMSAGESLGTSSLPAPSFLFAGFYFRVSFENLSAMHHKTTQQSTKTTACFCPFGPLVVPSKILTNRLLTIVDSSRLSSD